MIENKIQETTKSTVASSSNVTSPISRGNKNAFMSWLRDEDLTKDDTSKVSAVSAVVSFAKGLIEVVKTIYKRPVLSALTIITGIALASISQVYLLAPVMGVCIAAGAAGFCYAVYSVATKKSTSTVKQSYELMGISAFVLALGIYGILL